MTKDQKILQISLYAHWHMHSATNGLGETRVVRTGEDNHLLTPEELRNDTMETAKRHIERIGKIIEIPDDEWMG